METWLPIRVCGFSDVPLNFLVHYLDQLYLFDRPFSEELDDYPESYDVYRLPNDCDQTPLDLWWRLPENAIETFDSIAVNAVRFDPTKRDGIDPSLFQRLQPKPILSAGFGIPTPGVTMGPVPTAIN